MSTNEKRNETPTPAPRRTLWRNVPALADKTILEHLYLTTGTFEAIAAQTNCTRYQVYRAAKHHGIEIRKLKLQRDNKKHAHAEICTIRENRRPNPAVSRPAEIPACRIPDSGKTRIPKHHIMEFAEANSWETVLRSQTCTAEDIYAQDSPLWNCRIPERG